jgi:hypothetical protein
MKRSRYKCASSLSGITAVVPGTLGFAATNDTPVTERTLMSGYDGALPLARLAIPINDYPVAGLSQFVCPSCIRE